MCMPVLALSQVPYWQWNGEYSQLPERPMCAQDVAGKGFDPWQYPELHVATA